MGIVVSSRFFKGRTDGIKYRRKRRKIEHQRKILLKGEIKMTKIGILVGSLRRDSFSQKFAENMDLFFPESYELDIIEIGHLPFYSQDLDGEDYVHESFKLFREKVKEKDAFLFITPEYNRSFPAVLKNALDVGSRPPSENIWNGKAAAIISQSPGSYGGFGANHHLRQVMSAINLQVLQQPETYIRRSGEMFNEQGLLTDERTKKLLQKFSTAFVELIEKHV